MPGRHSGGSNLGGGFSSGGGASFGGPGGGWRPSGPWNQSGGIGGSPFGGLGGLLGGLFLGRLFGGGGYGGYGRGGGGCSGCGCGGLGCLLIIGVFFICVLSGGIGGLGRFVNNGGNYGYDPNGGSAPINNSGQGLSGLAAEPPKIQT